MTVKNHLLPAAIYPGQKVTLGDIWKTDIVHTVLSIEHNKACWGGLVYNVRLRPSDGALSYDDFKILINTEGCGALNGQPALFEAADANPQ